MRLLQGLLILIILGLQIRLWTGDGSLAEISQLNEAIDSQQAENENLAARNQELLTEVEELKTGTDAIEEMARQELGLIREGETFYMIVEPDTTGSDKAGSQGSTNDETSNAQDPAQ